MSTYSRLINDRYDMLSRMRTIVLALVFFSLGVPSLHAEQDLALTWAEWSAPKSAESVLAIPVLQAVMVRLQGSDRTILQVYYPGGDEGSLWAVELRGWLVSLGLESGRIKLVSGSRYDDRLQFQIVD